MEIWRDIEGYENLYMVSSYGRIKSLGNGCSNASKERILKPSTNTKGYLDIHLCKNGKEKMFLDKSELYSGKNTQFNL